MNPMKNKQKLIVGLSTAVFCILALLSCIYLDGIEYEPVVKAGEKAVFTMKVRVEPAQGANDERLVVGFLVPKIWDAAENTTVTYISTLYPGSVKTMSPIPEGNLPVNAGGLTWEAALRDRFGFGPNVLDDMEWLVYWTDDVESVTVRENFSVDIKIETLTGAENMKVKLGFFVSYLGDGFGTNQDSYKVLYTDCFEVVEGLGVPMDFCEPHFNMFQPSQVTKDDIVTIRFQGAVEPNVLDEVDEVYLCATAYTDAGNAADVSDRRPASKMTKAGSDGKTYSITLWPADYFNIPENESIERIEYFFSNKDGSLWVKETADNGTETPFVTPCICR
jgi:hypothetical protein